MTTDLDLNSHIALQRPILRDDCLAVIPHTVWTHAKDLNFSRRLLDPEICVAKGIVREFSAVEAMVKHLVQGGGDAEMMCRPITYPGGCVVQQLPGVEKPDDCFAVQAERIIRLGRHWIYERFGDLGRSWTFIFLARTKDGERVALKWTVVAWRLVGDGPCFLNVEPVGIRKLQDLQKRPDS